jgi:phosphotransferase system enzyme I (PtsI)
MNNSAGQQERIFRGIPASPGIGVGRVFLFRKEEPLVIERAIDAGEIAAEIERLKLAVARSLKELSKIFAFAEQKLDRKQSRIFEAQMMILEDAVLFESIYGRIGKEMKNAEAIVQGEIGKYQRMMLAAKDIYTQERANDLEEVRHRIVRNLQAQRLVSKFEGSHIIVSQNLGAADTLIFSRNDVLGYITEVGGATSHMALLSRALKIPAVVGVHGILSELQPDEEVIVDGHNGIVILRPDEPSKRAYERKKQEYHRVEESLIGLRNLPAETLDGHRVQLAANVELEQELEFVKKQGADGIGLYRSETLLIGKDSFPTEDEQFRQYQLMAETAFPNKAIIRTFDIGGDKLMADSIRENNPFLGWRGIRIMLDKPEVFLDQLRAILRASVRKNVAMLFPMVSNIKEVRLTKQLIAEAKDQLRSKGIPFDDHIECGVMIEVPAAAVISDDLAREVKFVSIGTNDLIQYLLAVDRGNDIVSDLYQEFHPAVVRFLRRIIERAKQEGVWVGMCGEMAGDPLATMLLIGLGLDEFSVVPTILPEIKKIIRSVHYTECKHLAERVLAMETEDEIKSYLRTLMKQKFPDLPMQ